MTPRITRCRSRSRPRRARPRRRGRGGRRPAERAEVRRERAREHRDRAVRQVDAAAARLGLVVDRRARGHVACSRRRWRSTRGSRRASRALDPHRVVVVARVLGIDGRQREVTQVLAPLLHRPRRPRRRRPRPRRRPSRSAASSIRSSTRIFATSTAELAGPPEHRLDAPLGVLVAASSGQRVIAHDDRVAVVAAVALGALGVDGARQDDGAAHARVVRLEPGALALAPQRAGHALDAALEDRDDLALGAARASRARPGRAPCRRASRRPAPRAGRRRRRPLAPRLAHEAEAARVHGEQPFALAVPGLAATSVFVGLAQTEALARAGRSGPPRGSGCRAGAAGRGSRPRRPGAATRSRERGAVVHPNREDPGSRRGSAGAWSSGR